LVKIYLKKRNKGSRNKIRKKKVITTSRTGIGNIRMGKGCKERRKDAKGEQDRLAKEQGW
jgi:hypothetical protein